MANSLKPWIYDYLKLIAENLGVKLYNEPWHEKPKKVQLAELLFRPQDPTVSPTWARVSDKRHIIIIKFSPAAVADFVQCSPGNTSLAQSKGAILKISKFKPFFSKYPINDNRISGISTICLECERVSLLGPPGEPTFGNVKNIQNEDSIEAWCAGLAQSGGAGNVLKERKALAQATGEAETTLSLPALVQPAEPKPSKSVIHKADDLESYYKMWKSKVLFDPDEVEANPLPMAKVLSRSDPDPGNGSQMSKNSSPEKQEATQGAPVPSIETLPAPTPAQRQRRSISRTVEEPISSLSSPAETQLSPTRRTKLARKIPRPASPKPRTGTSAGPTQILVADSEIEPGLPWMKMSRLSEIMQQTMKHRGLHN